MDTRGKEQEGKDFKKRAKLSCLALIDIQGFVIGDEPCLTRQLISQVLGQGKHPLMGQPIIKF